MKRKNNCSLLFLFFAVSSAAFFWYVSDVNAEPAVKLHLQSMESADRRIALIIGNSAYKSSPLKNPVNDAQDIAQKLKEEGKI